MEKNVNFVDCIITSPPYNIDAKYGDFDDSMPRKDYLIWMDDVANMMNNCLKKNGKFFKHGLYKCRSIYCNGCCNGI